MKGGIYMEGNLSFATTEHTTRASIAANCIINKSNSIYNVVCGFDLDTGDVLFFFPIDFLDGYSEEEQKQLTQKLRESWIFSNFEIIEETELSWNAYPEVRFCSYCYRLRSTI